MHENIEGIGDWDCVEDILEKIDHPHWDEWEDWDEDIWPMQLVLTFFVNRDLDPFDEDDEDGVSWKEEVGEVDRPSQIWLVKSKSRCGKSQVGDVTHCIEQAVVNWEALHAFQFVIFIDLRPERVAPRRKVSPANDIRT